MPAAARKAIFTVRLGLLSLFGGALMTASGVYFGGSQVSAYYYYRVRFAAECGWS